MGSPRPTKSCPRVKYFGFNFARGSESPFVHCTQPYGFACQPLRGLVTSRNGELSKEKDNGCNYSLRNLSLKNPKPYQYFSILYPKKNN